LQSFVNLQTLGARGDGNDIWGWTDPQTNREYAIFGAYDGTSFVDITVPTQPSVLGFLATKTVGSSWRDIKVYNNHAFIVSEAKGHGMQVFDLTQLRTMEQRPFLFANGTFNQQPPPALKETAFYGDFGNAHNIVINEESGYAYAVGTGTCRGGLHIVDIKVPLSPTYAGCFSTDGYTHDAQCVIYKGPDAEFRGKEVCFCYNEETLTIVDVSNKASPVQISRIGYSGVAYTHQGWLLKDSSRLLLNDELDEVYGLTPEGRTRTLLWDISSLRSPKYQHSYLAEDKSIDHNLYIIEDTAYLANYCDGLRVLDVSRAALNIIHQIAFFDVAPSCNTLEFLGSWSSYPYFASGNIVVSSIERGLFVLKMNGDLTCSKQ
jgi:choice-of-anchor B domain-containing protein